MSHSLIRPIRDALARTGTRLGDPGERCVTDVEFLGTLGCSGERRPPPALGTVNASSHRLAHRRKLQIASSIAARTPKRRDSLRVHVDWIRASNVRFGEKEAISRLSRHWPMFASRTDRLVRSKLHGDLRLSAGDPFPHRRLLDDLDSATPRAQHRFDELVRGRQVLVVGSGPACRPTAADIDAADVIVTTERRHEFDLACGTPIVAYLSAIRGLHDVDDHVGDGAELVVVGPAALTGRPAPTGLDGRIRVMPAEDSSTFPGSRSAIARILYDVLAHHPATIVLGGVASFPAATETPDLAGDHAFVRILRNAGLVRAPEPLGQLLDLTTEDYLDVVDRFHEAAIAENARGALIA